MPLLRYSHPLIWPQHIAPTPKWERSINNAFKPGLTLQEALMFLQEEVDALQVQDATLVTDYEHIDNVRLQRKIGNEAGALLKIKLNHVLYEFACDKWVQVEQNLYALHLTLRNLRSVIGWGVGTLPQVLSGFAHGATITAHTPQAEEDWRRALGLGVTATLDDAHAVYRRRAKLVAENQEELTRLNLAMDQASKALG